MNRTMLASLLCTLAIGAVAAALGMGSGRDTVSPEVAGPQDAASTAPPGTAAARGGSIRIGTYDSRAVAIAYAGSRFNPVGQKMKEFEAAKQAGDAARVKELEAWGQQHQRQLHRQGFARVPVTDLLEHVKDRLPALAERLNLDAIAFDVNYRGEGVEAVDITMELVALYDPSEQSLKWAKEAMKREPVGLDEVEKSHAGH